MSDLIDRQAAIDGKISIQRSDGLEIYSDEAVPVEYLKSLPSAQPEQRWIPVSERLPEEGEWVMVTFGGKIAVCLAQDNDGALREVTSLISKNATEIWLYPEPEWGDGYAVWMPLPQPYKAESEDKDSK